MTISQGILFHLSRWRLKKWLKRTDEVNRSLSSDAYDDWRDRQLRQQLQDHFPASELRGKSVMDFGCGSGRLAVCLARECGAADVIGVDLATDNIREAREYVNQCGLANVSFVQSVNETSIAGQEESVDTICCFDVMEHVIHPDLIVAEWRRLLKPGGQVWLWWCPWRHPYGHHLNSLVPLPWVHLVCSEQTLMAVAARVYDDECFVPRHWDLDSNGLKKPNKWRTQEGRLSTWLNTLSLGQLKTIARQNGFEVRHVAHGFGNAGGGLRRLLGKMSRLPVLGECFTAFYTVVLTKRAALSTAWSRHATPQPSPSTKRPESCDGLMSGDAGGSAITSARTCEGSK